MAVNLKKFGIKKPEKVPKVQTFAKQVEYVTLPGKDGKSVIHYKDGSVKLWDLRSDCIREYDPGEYLEKSEFDALHIAKISGIEDIPLFTIALANMVEYRTFAYDRFAFAKGKNERQNQALDNAQSLAYDVRLRRDLSATGAQLQANLSCRPELKKLNIAEELAKPPLWELIEKANGGKSNADDIHTGK